MTSKIFWTIFSEKQILLIKDYYLKRYSKKAFSDLKKSIYNSVDQLQANPLIGQREASLIHLNKEIRYLVVKSYKVLYLP